MVSKTLLCLAVALCAVSAASAAMLDIDAINGNPSTDTAKVSILGTDVITGVAYKAKGTLDFDTTAITTAISGGATSVPIVVTAGSKTGSVTLSATDATSLAAVDMWMPAALYANADGTTLGFAYTNLPKASLTANVKYIQVFAAYNQATWGGVTVALKIEYTSTVGSLTATTALAYERTLATLGADGGSIPLIIPVNAGAGTGTTEKLYMKVVAGTSNSITTGTAYDAATGLFSKQFTASADLNTCVVVGDCGSNDLAACSTQSSYPLDFVCDTITWTGGVSAVKPMVTLFALVAAMLAGLLAW